MPLYVDFSPVGISGDVDNAKGLDPAPLQSHLEEDDKLSLAKLLTLKMNILLGILFYFILFSPKHLFSFYCSIKK